MGIHRVLLTDWAWPDAALERAVLAEGGAELVLAPATDAATLASLAPEMDAILTCWAPVVESVIRAARKCRIIARMGVGLDNIDLAAAARHGMLVTNVPDYCVHEVADHALALILTLARNVAHFHVETKAGRYDRSSGPPLRRLAGQTLGLVGCGAIGKEVARRVQPLGMRVLACTRGNGMLPPGVERVELAELLVQSDYVSLHLPLTEQTRGLIGEGALRQMKEGSFLINTARGGLVDHKALAQALAEGRLAGAALDVQDPEPPPLDQPPYNDPRVIVTPHAAFISREALIELRTRACRQVLCCLQGGAPENIVCGPPRSQDH